MVTELEDGGGDYAVIGGFALGVLGAPRATAGLDLLVLRENLHAIHALLAGLGYERSVETENVSHYQHPDVTWGSVDLLHAFRSHSIAMLRRARRYPVLNGSAVIRVLEPEDIVGLKVQPIADDPGRRNQDVADIEALLSIHAPKIDWARLREYFGLFDLAAELTELEKRYLRAE
ncbi:MAG: hypothetical protein U0527_09790 [Candidatus Eisenbacteria bacterium]